MPILPVLDLKQGLIVRGIAGRRDEYRPIVSTLTSSARPVDVARALHDHFGFTDFYLADLDAIAGATPAYSVFDLLHAEGLSLWVDAGLRTTDDARAMAATAVASVIAGLETMADPATLRELFERLGSDRMVFSLDLKDGQPLCDLARWGATDALEVAERAISMGISRLVVLDLSRVGVGSGVGTEDLCSRLRQTHPDLEIAAGGGVRGAADVQRLHECQVDYVLVASALHDGRLTADSVQSFQVESQ
jgi:phosphoribosylformimino-5-aminoimidazole carboxamide ribotide isomerase